MPAITTLKEILLTKKLESVLLKHPDQIKWLLEKATYGDLLKAKDQAKKLIAIFDSKPFTRKCGHKSCESISSHHLFIPKDNLSGHAFRCKQCAPNPKTYIPGFQVISSYEESLKHVELYCNNKSNLKKIIKILAEAKGLPRNAREKQILEFFSVN